MGRSLLRWGIVLGVVGWLGPGLGASGFGQATVAVPPAPPSGVAAVVPGNLAETARAMAGDLRPLERAIDADIGRTDAGKVLARDTRELAQAVDEFAATLKNTTGRFTARFAYSGIDNSWHYLLGQLSTPATRTPAIDRAAGRVVQDDEKVHQALGLNPVPTTYYTATTAPTGIAQVKRLARALDDRAAALADVIRADLNGPGGSRVVQLAANLATAADAFHDGIDMNAPFVVARNGFAGVQAMTGDLRRVLQLDALTARVRAAWQSYLAVEVLLRQALGLVVPPADLAGTAVAAKGPSPVVAQSDRLVAQVKDFLDAFSLNAGTIPEGNSLLADVQRLQTAAADFRQDAARGLEPGPLAFEFRDVDALWQRLARRTNRLARGPIGPYLEAISRMGQAVAEIHRLLGLPGYPADVARAASTR